MVGSHRSPDDDEVPEPADEAAGGDPAIEHEQRAREIAALAEEAREARESFQPPEDPDERAMTVLEEGLWPVLDVYIEARGSGQRFSAVEASDLERALNDWLAVYTRCYGVEMDPAFSVRETAEVFVNTHNVRDTAQLLTDVPDRAARRRS